MKPALPTQLFLWFALTPPLAYLFSVSTSSSKSYCVIRGGCWAVGTAMCWLLLCGDLLLFSWWLAARCPSTHHGCCACACCCCCSLLVLSSVAWWLVSGGLLCCGGVSLLVWASGFSILLGWLHGGCCCLRVAWPWLRGCLAGCCVCHVLSWLQGVLAGLLVC